LANLFTLYKASFWLVFAHRTLKTVMLHAQGQTTWQTTHYVRDASGNVMATYTENYVEDGEWQSHLSLTGIPFYGSM
jgi:hypothetical protein